MQIVPISVISTRSDEIGETVPNGGSVRALTKSWADHDP
jgi:hypothetical protein